MRPPVLKLLMNFLAILTSPNLLKKLLEIIMIVLITILITNIMMLEKALQIILKPVNIYVSMNQNATTGLLIKTTTDVSLNLQTLDSMNT